MIVYPLPHSSSAPSSWRKEVVYQIFERSFYDSDGDRVGDFKGIQQKLPYLEKLGVTAILVQPIFASRFYHNYFADSFTKIDQSLGGTDQFFRFVDEAHRKHLKVIVDIEPQYVADRHAWYLEGDKGHKILPHTGFYGLQKVPIYSGRSIGLSMVNLSNPTVKSEIAEDLLKLVAPNGDAARGVDGFRIDHMMDDLDKAHLNTHLLSGFWAPLEGEIRRRKPGFFFVAEPADWSSFGQPLFDQGKVDAVYAIPLRFAILNALKGGKVDTALLNCLKLQQSAIPTGDTDLTILEDHDVERLGSTFSDPRKLRLAAAIQFCLQGTPSIYYGQELGMKGEPLKGKDDGNDIPIRLAFRWTSRLDSQGTAAWYPNGPWRNPTFSHDHDGISVQEEVADPWSLLNLYRSLIRIRRQSLPLTLGDQKAVRSNNQAILMVARKWKAQMAIAVFNFSAQPQRFASPKNAKSLLTRATAPIELMAPYGFDYFQVSN